MVTVAAKPKPVDLSPAECLSRHPGNFDFPAETLVFLDGGPPNSVNMFLWAIFKCVSTFK